MVFCCASTARVWVSKSMGPLRNLLPSADTARVDEITGTMRLLSTMEDATSNTNTVRVAVCKLTPMISLPSSDACKRLFPARYMMPFGGGSEGATGAGGATDKACVVPSTGS